MYASPFSHLCLEQCPRDDVFTVLFVFLSLAVGQLPWSQLAKEKERDAITEWKLSWLANPQEMIDWLESTAKENDDNIGDLVPDQRISDKSIQSFEESEEHCCGKPGRSSTPASYRFFLPTMKNECLKIMNHLKVSNFSEMHNHYWSNISYTPLLRI